MRIRHLAFLTLALVVSGCGNQAAEEHAARAQATIEGALNEASYNRAAAKVVAQATHANANLALTEDQLDVQIDGVEAIIALADKLDLDKARLSEAELTSTLGSLLVRKASFHVDAPRQAGIYTSTGFRYLDRAVSKYPDNLTVRINRGIVSAKVPEFMHKTDVAKEDLDYVASSAAFDKLAPDLQALVRSARDDVNRRLAGAGQGL